MIVKGWKNEAKFIVSSMQNMIKLTRTARRNSYCKHAWIPKEFRTHWRSFNLRPKKKNCCIGVTRPTLILPPTLDIFIYLFIFFWGEKNKNKSIIMDIKVGKPQNMQLYVRRKVKMFRSPILLCGYGLCVQV